MTKIASLYAERLMSDLILVVGKQELPAHRLILCASSEVFQVSALVFLWIKYMSPLQVMLMNKNWAEHEEKRIILKETPACQNVFEVSGDNIQHFVSFDYISHFRFSSNTSTRERSKSTMPMSSLSFSSPTSIMWRTFSGGNCSLWF